MTMIIGHRGARNLWPENSLSGFRNLRALDVEGVEFDLHLDAAGEILVMHDATMDRTSEGVGPIAALAAGEHRSVFLKGSDAGDVIPTLEEVLAIFADSDIELHVELKADAEGRPYAGLEQKAAAMLDRFGMARRSFLTSFNNDVLRELRRVAPHIRTLSSYDWKGAGAEGVVPGLLARMELADVVAVERKLLADQWDVITANIGMERLGVWTPNAREDLDLWMNRGLRQVTTDNPDIALLARAG